MSKYFNSIEEAYKYLIKHSYPSSNDEPVIKRIEDAKNIIEELILKNKENIK